MTATLRVSNVQQSGSFTLWGMFSGSSDQLEEAREGTRPRAKWLRQLSAERALHRQAQVLGQTAPGLPDSVRFGEGDLGSWLFCFLLFGRRVLTLTSQSSS